MPIGKKSKISYGVQLPYEGNSFTHFWISGNLFPITINNIITLFAKQAKKCYPERVYRNKNKAVRIFKNCPKGSMLFKHYINPYRYSHEVYTIMVKM